MSRRDKIEVPGHYDPPPPHLLECAAEQALCYDFIDEAQLMGWKVFPEYPDSTFDLLLVAEDGCFTEGVKPGTQIGVQAKMHANLDLLRQMLNVSEQRKRGPDYFVALVPAAPKTDGERTVARALKRMHLGFFYVYEYFDGNHNRAIKRKNLLTTKHFGSHQKHQEQIVLPEVDTWTEPGVASPSPVSTWMMRAIKFCMELERLGAADYIEFGRHKMHVQRWIDANWVIQDGRQGRRFLYKLNPGSPGDRPDLRHPDIKLQLERKLKKHAPQDDGQAREKGAA